MASGEHGRIPGLALLLAVLAPTGTPPEQAGDPWAAGATGKGSWEGSLGVGIDHASEPYFVTFSGLVTWRSPRTVAGTRETFAARWTGIAAVGRVLPHLATVGLYGSVIRQGNNRDGGGEIGGSGSSLLTTGIAATLSPTEQWRVQGTFFANIPAGGWGRNETAGAGASLSLMRLWL